MFAVTINISSLLISFLFCNNQHTSPTLEFNPLGPSLPNGSHIGSGANVLQQVRDHLKNCELVITSRK